MMLDKFQLLEDVFIDQGVSDDMIIRERLLDSEIMSILVDGDDYYIAFYDDAELFKQFGVTLPDMHYDRAILFYDMGVALSYLGSIEKLETL